MKLYKPFAAALLAGMIALTPPAHAGIFSMMAASEASNANETAKETAKTVEQLQKEIADMKAILEQIQKALAEQAKKPDGK